MRAAMFLLGVALLVALSPGAQAETVNQQLLRYYGKHQNYRVVRKEVLGWYGTTKNGCVAFLSTALRHIGQDVPQDGRIDDERISLLTLPFSRHLEEKLGWKRITDVDDLVPGDIVFTENASYPWHTYLFHSWKNRKKRIAWVIDNQGWKYPRDVMGYGSGNFTPFAYALRAPE